MQPEESDTAPRPAAAAEAEAPEHGVAGPGIPETPVPEPTTERPLPPLPAGIADGRERPLDRRALTVRRIVGAIVCTILGVATSVAGALLTFFRSPLEPWEWLVIGGPWLVINGAALWLAFGWTALAFRYTSWRVDQRGMRIRRGVLWRREQSIPKNRVQHTDVSRGPLERSYGLATLVIHTAGTHNASVSLSGLAHADALAVRDHLIGEERETDGDGV